MKKYLYFGSEKIKPIISTHYFEFDESDVWNSAQVASSEPKRPFSGSKKYTKKNDHSNDNERAVSVPVNVLDWSQILRGEYKSRTTKIEECHENEDGDEKVPPHEYLARTRVASCSVHEGLGRTLKGRDLRMVRNAVWKHTGFED